MGGLRQKLRRAFHKGFSSAPQDVPESTAQGARAAAVKAITQSYDGTAVNLSDSGRREQDQLDKERRSSIDSTQHDENSQPGPGAESPVVTTHQSHATSRGDGFGDPAMSEQHDKVGGQVPDGILDRPRYTEETTIHEQQATPVTHETIRHDVHEIREEQIDLEIHEHHEIRHIQPVIQTEVLSARHFVTTENGLKEITDMFREKMEISP